MTKRSILRGFNSYKRRVGLQESLWLETEAAAAEGRCQGQLTQEIYKYIKVQEQAKYRDPGERLDFWRRIETGIINGEQAGWGILTGDRGAGAGWCPSPAS